MTVDESIYYPTREKHDTVVDKKIKDIFLHNKVKVRRYDNDRGAHFVPANSSEHIGAFNTTWEGVIDHLPQ